MPNNQLTPPPLTNDCFAMPAGTHWTPVDEALAHLRENLHPAVGTETIPVTQALNRVLAADVVAQRSHPPAANSAVDGYGFAHGATHDGPQSLPLVDGRSAAGQPYPGTVPVGQAIRILTGAILPDGVDTVILQENITTDGQNIAFHGPLKPGSNCRKAGEDMKAGDVILHAGRRLTPGDLGMLTAAGVAEISTYRPLRVAILSTGDELRQPGDVTVTPGQVYDANRPMLAAQIADWGYEVIDLGCAPDQDQAMRDHLDRGAAEADVILTSGGASAGDEDHLSRLLRETGSMALWRIAIKPGRPLALGLWNGTPVFGLPGNPVAAQVCTLIFTRPALSVLSGAGWTEPRAQTLPANFSKSKKPGRREYLRARLRDGKVEIFQSEGSGRVSGLSWAEGLVELPDEAATIAPGTPVRYIPFEGFR